MIPVLFVVTILVFSIIRFIPGEPARLILGEKATEEAVAALTEKLGLNEPLLTQYLLFLKQIFTLDFGNSFTYQMPVSELLASRFPVTLALTLMSTVISLVISLPLGYFAGVHKDRLGDQVVRTTSLVAISMPSFCGPAADDRLCPEAEMAAGRRLVGHPSGTVPLPDPARRHPVPHDLRPAAAQHPQLGGGYHPHGLCGLCPQQGHYQQ